MRKITRDISVAFIFSNDNKMLLGHTIKGGAYEGVWVIPGGGIEEGETAQGAVVREVFEEAGLDITDAIVEEKSVSTGVTEKTLRDTGERVVMEMIIHNFVVNIDKLAHEITINAGDDLADLTWFDVKDLPTLKITEPSILFLRQFGYM